MEFLARQKVNRSFSRLDFHARVHYWARGKRNFDSALTNDISCGGLKLTSDRQLSFSDALMLEINILDRVLRPVGKVAWSRILPHSNRSQTGIEFIEFNMFEKKFLKDFINLRLG